MSNLAGLYASAGDHAEALELYEACFEHRAETYGADHPDTLDALAGASAVVL